MPAEPKREIAHAIVTEYELLHGKFESRRSITPANVTTMESNHPVLVAHHIQLSVGPAGVALEIPRALVKWSKTAEELAPEAKISGSTGILRAWGEFKKNNSHVDDTPFERHRAFQDEPDPHLGNVDDEEEEEEGNSGHPTGGKDGHYASVRLAGHPMGEGALLRSFHRTQKGEGRPLAMIDVKTFTDPAKGSREVVRYWFDHEFAVPLIDRLLNHRFFFTPDKKP